MKNNKEMDIVPMNFLFAQELPSNLELERKSLAGDSTTWDPAIPQFTSDD